MNLFPQHDAALDSWLRSGARVLSILGPPGIGKTTWIQRRLPNAVYLDARHMKSPEEVISGLWSRLDPGEAVTLEAHLATRSGELVLDHVDEVWEGLEELLERWMRRARKWRFVLVSRRPHPPWEQHLLTLQAPDPGAIATLLERWLPDMPGLWRNRLIHRTHGNPGALFVLSRRARWMSPRELLEGLETPGMLGAFEASLEGALGARTHQMLQDLSLFHGSFSLAEARAVCATSFDIDAFQELIDAGWLIGDGPWRLPPLLRASPGPPPYASYAQVMDAWANRWWSAQPRDMAQLSERFDDLVHAWQNMPSGTHPHLYAVLAWLTSASGSSTWRESEQSATLRSPEELDTQLRALLSDRRWDEATALLRAGLTEHTEDQERMVLWGRLAKLHKRQGATLASTRAYEEAAQAAIGVGDAAAAAKYLWRAILGWRALQDAELERDSLTELEVLLQEHPKLSPPPEYVSLVSPVEMLQPPDTETLCVNATRNAFVSQDGARVDLRRKRVATRLLKALVAQHEEHPGVAISAQDLFARAWPGQERISMASALNRLRVAITRLRAIGLDPWLVTTQDGYLLATTTRLDALP